MAQLVDHAKIKDVDNSAVATPDTKPIEEIDRQHAGNGLVFNGIRASPTLGALLKAFSYSQVQQLNVGVGGGVEAFHPTTLTVWRHRVAASDRPQRIFEVVRELILETGVVKGKTRRATDSTILEDVVARQDK